MAFAATQFLVSTQAAGLRRGAQSCSAKTCMTLSLASCLLFASRLCTHRNLGDAGSSWNLHITSGCRAVGSYLIITACPLSGCIGSRLAAEGHAGC